MNKHNFQHGKVHLVCILHKHEYILENVNLLIKNIYIYLYKPRFSVDRIASDPSVSKEHGVFSLKKIQKVEVSLIGNIWIFENRCLYTKRSFQSLPLNKKSIC